MTTSLLVAALIFIGFVYLAYRQAANTTKRKEQLALAARQIPDFTISQKFEGFNSYFLFVVDSVHSKIALIQPTSKKIASFSDIIKVEVVEDGETISTKSTTRTIGGAVLGGVLAGGVGAIVGGLSGGARNVEKASTVMVKILLRDIDAPSMQIMCFESKTMISTKPDSYAKKGKSESQIYINGRKQADQIKDLISVIIDKVDREAKVAASTPDLAPPRASVTEELMKLHNLKEMGVLSEEEFQSQKSKLLA